MKKLHLFLLVLCLGIAKVNAQDLDYTPDAAFDTIYDYIGNRYLLKDYAISVDDSTAARQVASTTSCTAGYFNVYFATGSGFETSADAAKRAVICEVLNNISGMVKPSLISTTTRVSLLVDNPANVNMGSALGVASGFYVIAAGSSNPGYVRNAVEKTIISGQNAYINISPALNASGGPYFYHGMMAFNTSTNWHTTMSSVPPSGYYDLYTVALHEITHALGFASLINYNGQSRFGPTNPYYSTYDKFLCTSGGTPLLAPQVPNCPNYLLTYQGGSTGVSPNGTICTANSNSTTCSSAVRYISNSLPSGLNMKVYTPNCYEMGCISHFEDMCYPTNNPANNDQYFTMSNVTYPATIKRYLKEEERAVLCDLGYTCTATYTSNAILSTSLNTTQTYTAGSCTPNTLFGINDGLSGSSYVYSGTSTINIPISAIKANDSPSTTPICVTFAYNYNLTLNTTSTNIQIVVNSGSGFCGPVVLQYLPKDAAGNFGNITYVYAFVTCPGCNAPSNCNMVANGGFEVTQGNWNCGQWTIYNSAAYVKCWYNQKGSPDLYTRGCTNGPLYTIGNPSLTASSGMTNTHNGLPNNNAVGLAFSTQTITGGGEVMENSLTAPLVPTATYVLDFWAFNAKYQGSYTDAVFSFATEPSFFGSYPPGNFFPGAYNTIASFTMPASTAGTWQHYSKTFVFSSPGSLMHSGLLCGPDYSLTIQQPNAGYYGADVIIDDVSLVPIGQYAPFNLPNAMCSSNSLTNIAQYGDPLPGTFNGPGVTYTNGQYDFNTSHTLTPGTYGISFNYSLTGSSCTYTTWSVAYVGGIITQTNTSTCSNNAYTLSAAGFSAGTTYTWLPGGSNASNLYINPSSTTIYTLIAKNGTCTVTYTTPIVIAGTPSINPLPPVCFPSSSNYLQTYIAAGTLTTGIFTGPNIINGNCSGAICSWISLATTTNTPGTYNYTYTIYPDPSIGLYCTTSTTFNVTYAPGFTVTASVAGIVCSNISGNNTTVTATSSPSTGVTYTWMPGNISGQTVTVSPTSTTIYTVNASNSQCLFSANVIVTTSSACCTGTAPAFTGSLLPSGTVSGSKIFNSDVFVPTGATSYLQGEMIFAPNVKVIVQPGGYLVVDLAHLYACTDMWQGIVVNDGGRVTSARTNFIEDAITAIDVTGHTTSAFTPPTYILDIESTTFNKNLVAINIDGYVRSSAGYPFLIHSNVFTSRTFTFNSTTWPYSTTNTPDLRYTTSTATTALAPPYALQSATLANLKNPYSALTASIGVLINNSGYSSGANYYGVDVGLTGTESAFNLFDNLLFGISGYNSVINSYNNVFQSSQRYHLCPQHCGFAGGYGIYSEVNTDFNTRLNMTSTGTGSTSLSLGNRFWDCHIGVGTSNVYKLDCNYALFRSTQTTTTGTGFAPGNTGIYAATDRFQYTINNCKFQNINTGINIPITAGTYTFVGNGSGILANNFNILYNYFGAQVANTTSISGQFMNYGIYITAANTASWNVIAGSPLSITSNTVNRTYRGIYLNGYPTQSTIESNTISLVNDNVFNTNQSAIRVENSTFNVIKTNTITGANTTNSLVSLIFSGSNGSQGVTCNTLVSGYAGFEFDGIHGGTNVWKGNKMTSQAIGFMLNNNGIIGTQGSSGNPVDNIWSGSWTSSYGTYVGTSSSALNSPVWTKTTSTLYPPSPSGTVSNTYWYGAANTISTTTGSYGCGGGCGCCGCRAVINLPENSVQNNSSTSRLVSQISDVQYIGMTNNYRFLMNNDSVRNSDSVYIQFCDNLSGTSIDIFMQAENNFYTGNINQGQLLAAAVSPTNDIESNYKHYYDLYTTYVNGNFSSADSSDLFTFTQKCPGLDGSCIYQARALYSAIYKLSFTYSDDCPTIDAERKKSKTEQNNNINGIWNVDLYPNPTTKHVNVISSVSSEVLTVTIKDVNGRIIDERTLTTQNFISNLELSLVKGIYLVTIKSARNEAVTKKLIIAD